MANQESGGIKQMKLRIPMEVYRQLEIYAEVHNEKPATSARHILVDTLMGIDITTPEERRRIAEMVRENWEKINRSPASRAKAAKPEADKPKTNTNYTEKGVM